MTQKSRFALYFGNRGFFPASLQAEAREELPRVLEAAGHEVIMLDAQATRYGAVETPQEGQIFANFLRQNQGKYDGVILSLPILGMKMEPWRPSRNPGCRSSSSLPG